MERDDGSLVVSQHESTSNVELLSKDKYLDEEETRRLSSCSSAKLHEPNKHEVDEHGTPGEKKSIYSQSAKVEASISQEHQQQPSSSNSGNSSSSSSSSSKNVRVLSPSLSLSPSPRERLKRHRREVAGNVWIPESWGQEPLLKDWIDCSAFDASLVSHNIMRARASLMDQHQHQPPRVHVASLPL